MALLSAAAAAKAMERMPSNDRARLLKALKAVAAEPSRRFPFITEMAGRPSEWRLRKGDWRAVYRIEGADVVVLLIGHRREVYR